MTNLFRLVTYWVGGTRIVQYSNWGGAEVVIAQFASWPQGFSNLIVSCIGH